MLFTRCARQAQASYRAVQFGDSVQLQPVAGFQAIQVAAMLALIKVKFRHQSVLLPTPFWLFWPGFGCTLQMQTANEISRLGEAIFLVSVV